MVDFAKYNATTHPIVKLDDDWNNAVDHAFEKPYQFTLRKKSTLWEAIYGDAADQAGKVYDRNADMVTLLNDVMVNGLTAGRTAKEHVLVKGVGDVNSSILLPDYCSLDVRGGLKITTAAISLFDSPDVVTADSEEVDINITDIDCNNLQVDLFTKVFFKLTFKNAIFRNCSPTQGITVFANGGIDVRIEDLYFDKPKNVNFGQVDYSVIQRCKVIGDGTQTIGGSIIDYSSGYNKFLHNEIRGFTYDAMRSFNCSHSLCEGNVFEMLNPTGGADGLWGNFSDTIVRNNWFIEVASEQIENGSGTNCLIEGNRIWNSAASKKFILSTSSILRNNYGVNPYGKITNPFYNTSPYGIGLKGTAATPTASRTYNIQNLDCIISSTNSGNADNAIQIKDPAGNNVNPTTLSTLDGYFLPIRYQINWGAFTGAAPTVVACGV